MIFRRNKTRLISIPALQEVVYAEIPPRRRVVATWRRDATSGRITMVWKLVQTDGKRAA
ncbi:hypothetical protein [Acidocella sp.]|jgi:hypothetical protein|uniref:hypothetical protein n=1 Tax=Acidocella sp. TaxID=50710 RepID=UPI002F40ECBE